MKISKIALASAAFLGSASLAQAACDVVQSGILSHTETDCASAATVAAQGISIGSLQTSDTTQNGQISALQGTVAGHTTQIGSLQTSDAAQNTHLTTHDGQISALQTTTGVQGGLIVGNYILDGIQQGQINANTATNLIQQGQIAGHEARLDANDTKNDDQDLTLASHGAQLTDHNTRIGSLETLTSEHEGRLDAHDALLSQQASTLKNHGNRLDEHDKGLAIAMSLPDAWLSDSKRFGIFGSVGGFNDETAVGFAAIGRIDGNWSLNAKLGSDTEFKQLGWQAGVGAQW